MLQEIFRFHLFGHTFPVYGYGMMLVVSFFVCLKTVQWLARRVGMNADLFVDVALIALSTGVIGARICHVVENIRDYTRTDLTLWQNLANAVNLREGGLTFYGGLLLATPCCIFYGWIRKAPIKLGMDIVAPAVMIGLGLGRIGCFLNGCCYGATCDVPWAVRFPYYSNAYIDQMRQGKIHPPATLLTANGTLIRPDSEGATSNPTIASSIAFQRSLPVQPAQLFSAFTAFLLGIILIFYLGLPHADGQVFAMMVAVEGLARFILELLRVEPAVWQFTARGHVYGFSLGMIFGLIDLLIGVILWAWLTPTSAGFQGRISISPN